jgi:hypothetical protein
MFLNELKTDDLSLSEWNGPVLLALSKMLSIVLSLIS